MVNIGGFIGPMVAGAMRAISWDAVFLMSAAWIVLNFIPVLLFYRDPPALRQQHASLSLMFKQAQQVLGNARFALLIALSVIVLMSAGVQWLSYGSAFLLIALWVGANLLWDRLPVATMSAKTWWRQPIRISNPRFALYLLILTGFWTVYNQLFYTLPLYIRDYVDTGDVLALLAVFGDSAVNFFAHVDQDALAQAVNALFLQLQQGPSNIDLEALRLQWVHYKVNVPNAELAVLVERLSLLAQQQAQLSKVQLTAMVDALSAYRQINPEYLINLDFAAIVLLQIAVSALCQRFKTFYVLSAGLVVMAMAFCYLITMDMHASGWAVVCVILLIALAEMLTSPKSQEYVASIAPKQQAALYMGYYFVSMALGFLFAGFLSGWSYSQLTLVLGRPELMWGLFAGIAALTAVALICFHSSAKQQ